jgi:hypothetical protein
MKRAALCSLTVWMCLGSTARADLVPGEKLGTGTNLNSFFVMCASDEQSDLCTDDIKVNPLPLGQENGTAKLSADLATMSFVETVINRDDKRIITDPASPTTVPEPASVPAIWACLAVFVIGSLRGSRKRTRTYRLPGDAGAV